MEFFDVLFGAFITSYLFLGVIAFLAFVFWVWMLVDCLNNIEPVGNEKIVWILVIILTTGLGALIYFFSKIISSGDNKKIVFASILFSLILLVVVMFAAFIYSTPKMIAAASKAQNYVPTNTSFKTSQNSYNSNKYLDSRVTNKGEVAKGKNNKPKNVYELSDVKINGQGTNEIPNTEIVRKIKSKSHNGKYVEVGKWRNDRALDKGIVTILDYGNKVILVEYFESGIQIEHSLKKMLSEPNQKYHFVGTDIEEDYVVDRYGNLTVSDSLGLKENLKPI